MSERACSLHILCVSDSLFVSDSISIDLYNVERDFTVGVTSKDGGGCV